MVCATDMPVVLAGDIGGTKTYLALFTAGAKRPAPRVLKSHASREAPDLESLIEGFLKVHPASVSAACFGVAGPVVNGQSRTTNLPWHISERRIQSRFQWPRVKLVNDLTATAMALPLLNSKELAPLNRARVRRGQNLALVAPGTGLGQALLVHERDRYLPVPSEGGHADFAPTDPHQVLLWQYLRRRFKHVSVERVLSGSGLVHIYSWLKDSGRFREPAWLARRMKESDFAAVISEGAITRRTPICTAALNLFVSVLGSVAGNLALTGMATGGVYLGGGIPPRILSCLKENGFMAAFIDKGRFKGFMERIAVRVILNDRAALLGAAQWALDHLAGRS